MLVIHSQQKQKIGHVRGIKVLLHLGNNDQHLVNKRRLLDEATDQNVENLDVLVDVQVW